MHGLLQDVQFAFRLFARRPLATAIAIATLGLGIGANIAIFSVVRPILIDALPYPNGDRTVLLWEREKGGSTSNTSFSTFADLRGQSTTLDRKAAVRDWSPTLLGAGESTRLSGQRVSAEFLGVLGVAPALGRDFRSEEDQAGAARGYPSTVRWVSWLSWLYVIWTKGPLRNRRLIIHVDRHLHHFHRPGELAVRGGAATGDAVR